VYACTDQFWRDLEHWITQDAKTAIRLLRLVRATARSPFQGIGKPEPLKHSAGYWSRRLTEEHRFVYRVTAAELVCVQARFHY